MRISTISNQIHSYKPANHDKIYHYNRLSESAKTIVFKGNKASLFTKFSSIKFNHDYLPKTADKAIEYLGKLKKITFESDISGYDLIGSIKIYKNILGKKAMIHQYIFVKGSINEPDTLSISEAYNHKTLKKDRSYYFREDDDLENRTLYLKRIFYQMPRIVPLGERTPKDHNIRVSKHYRLDETLDFVVEYDRMGNVILSKYYDKTGKKIVRRGHENPSEYP